MQGFKKKNIAMIDIKRGNKNSYLNALLISDETPKLAWDTSAACKQWAGCQWGFSWTQQFAYTLQIAAA